MLAAYAAVRAEHFDVRAARRHEQQRLSIAGGDGQWRFVILLSGSAGSYARWNPWLRSTFATCSV
jgi:hypothetical protein